MRSVVTRMIRWIAEILDRNLITVPDVDLYVDGVTDQATDLANSSWQPSR
jgi:hypothetical protein